MWDLGTGETLRTFEGHTAGVSVTPVTAILADGQRAISISYDKLLLWDLHTGNTLRTLKGHTDRVNAVAVFADGRRCVSGSDDQTLRLWDLETAETLHTFEGHTSEGHTRLATAVAVLSDERRALSGSWDSTLRLWDLRTGETLRNFEGHKNRVTAVAVFAAERRALSGSADHTLRLWDLTTGEHRHTLEGHMAPVTAIAVLADDTSCPLWLRRRNYSGCGISANGQPLRTLEGHTGSVTLWQRWPTAAVRSQAPRTTRCGCGILRPAGPYVSLKGHTGRVVAVAVLADGRCGLSGSWDNTLRLWDFETGETLRTFAGHDRIGSPPWRSLLAGAGPFPAPLIVLCGYGISRLANASPSTLPMRQSTMSPPPGMI